MATLTDNLGLSKPAKTDYYDITEHNSNLDKIDEAVAGKAAASHTHTLDNLDGTLSISKGGTGATTAEGVFNSLGIADYVVEAGEDLGWVYRKWSSGFAEIWTRVTFEGNIDTPIGNMYYGTVPSVSYPFQIRYPKIQATYISSTGYIAWFGGSYTSSSTPSETETGSMSLVRPTIQNSELGYLYLYVTGYWKW